MTGKGRGISGAEGAWVGTVVCHRGMGTFCNATWDQRLTPPRPTDLLTFRRQAVGFVAKDASIFIRGRRPLDPHGLTTSSGFAKNDAVLGLRGLLGQAATGPGA